MGAYLSALAVCASSLLIGAALCGRRGGWSWLAPATGLAVVVLLALAAIRLPGHGATAAAAVAVASLAAGVIVVRRGVPLQPLLEALPVAVAVLAICSLPFVANDRIGELGAYVLNDMVFHMEQADEMRRLGAEADVTSSGYPNGPHAVVAALASGLGVSIPLAFTGLLLAVPVLTALTALGALGGVRWYLRIPAAALAGVPYLAVSYFAMGAFKEPLLALFVLGFVLALRDSAPLTLALTAAGGVAVFGVSALAWPVTVLACFAALRLAHGWRPDLERWRPRRPAAVAATGVAGVAVVAALVAGARDFFESGPGQYLTSDSVGGNFRGQLSPFEALGVWRHPDFRYELADPLLQPGVLVACAAVAIGLVWCWRRGEWALLAGALGGAAIYAVARPVTLAYFSGKALMVVAPLLTLIALRALGCLASARSARLWVPATAVLAAFVLVAGASSALALRGARVRPHERGTDLAAFSPIVEGQRTLYLGRDSFADWELRKAILAHAGARPEKAATEDAPAPALDVDSADPFLLASVRYLVTSRSPYASRPPASFRPVARTRWHVLWRRVGPDPARGLLAEGEAPGAMLDCDTAAGRRLARSGGEALVRPEPVVGVAQDWAPSSVESGDSRTQRLVLPAGAWDISLRWFSDVPLRLSAGPLEATLPAYIGDETAFATVGRLSWTGGPLDVTVAVPARRRLESQRTARLGTVAATRVDEPARLVPLSEACGRYVDWYTVAP